MMPATDSLNSVGPAACIVATIGPASEAIVPAILEAGASALRVNTSHVSFDEMVTTVGRIREASAAVPIVLDLQGAKMRLGRFDPRPVARGDLVRFALDDLAPSTVPLPHPEFFNEVATGETVSVDDGRLAFIVRHGGRDWCATEALAAGLLHPRKGVNIVEHPIVLEDLTPDDCRICEYAAGLHRIALAFSFMVDGRESSWIRRCAPSTRIVGKVERREAVANLQSIAQQVDEVWVCRGDLGAQLGDAAMARWIAAFRPPPCGPPMLMAGQVLEHLTEHAEPTRSEVCHLHDLVTRGYAGIVLSDETAIGRQPASAVRTAARLLAAFEEAS